MSELHLSAVLLQHQKDFRQHFRVRTNETSGAVSNFQRRPIICEEVLISIVIGCLKESLTFGHCFEASVP